MLHHVRSLALVPFLLLAACGGSQTDSGASVTAQRVLGQVQAQSFGTTTFSGNLSQYTIVRDGDAFGVTDNVNGGTQTVLATDRPRFADTAMALDVDGNPGQAYRLYQAAFKRQPDLGGLGFQMNALDAGFSLAQVSQGFIDSPEFSATYGALDNTQFVTLLYNNVLGRAPDAGGLAFHVGYLEGSHPDGIVVSRAQTLVGFSESPENKALVLPAIINGMEYHPVGFTPPSTAVADFAGSYSGSFSGDEAGTLVLTFASNGGITASGRSDSFSVDLSGSGTVAVGGRFTLTLAGGGRERVLSGSVNLGGGLATGSWLADGTQDGVFKATKPTVSVFPQVQAIIVQRCVPCHSVAPTQPGFSSPPLGVTFDTEAQIRARASQIDALAVQSSFMPFGNATGMTQAERDFIGAWIAAGTP